MSSYLSPREASHAFKKDIAAHPLPRTTTRVLVGAAIEVLLLPGEDAATRFTCF